MLDESANSTRDRRNSDVGRDNLELFREDVRIMQRHNDPMPIIIKTALESERNKVFACERGRHVRASPGQRGAKEANQSKKQLEINRSKASSHRGAVEERHRAVANVGTRLIRSVFCAQISDGRDILGTSCNCFPVTSSCPDFSGTDRKGAMSAVLLGVSKTSVRMA